jgi:hypothetical protein
MESNILAGKTARGQFVTWLNRHEAVVTGAAAAVHKAEPAGYSY